MQLPMILKNFLNSEKAIALGVLVIAASVLFGLDKITVEQWMDYTKWLAGFYVGGKALQGAVAKLADSKVEAEKARTGE